MYQNINKFLITYTMVTNYLSVSIGCLYIYILGLLKKKKMFKSFSIEPYFFENEARSTVSVNELRYRTMINEFLWPELEDMDVDDVSFQQDGATCHTIGETIGLLREKFPD